MLKKTREENLKEWLETKFDGKVTDIVIKRQRRVWCKIQAKDILEVTKTLMNVLNFDYLCTITGVDYGDSIHALYHWGEKETGVIVTIEAVLPSGEILKSITPLILGAIYYERELADMFGVKFDALPPGNRYPLPDDFPADQHPLLKSWSSADYIKHAEEDVCQK